MKTKNIKVIFDTNVWISFLIGKSLASVKDYIVSRQVTIVTSEQLLLELKEVTKREKLKKYFSKEHVIDLLELLEIISVKIETHPLHFINRDPKDNFLLDLIELSQAGYLVTGDKDLLIHNPFKSAFIISPSDFEKELFKFID